MMMGVGLRFFYFGFLLEVGNRNGTRERKNRKLGIIT